METHKPPPPRVDIKELTNDELVAYLREVFDYEYVQTHTSPDHLLILGARTGSVASPAVDDFIRTWVAEELTEDRVDVVGSFLMGYWRSAPSPERLLSFMFGVVDTLRAEGGLEPSSLLIAFHVAYNQGTEEEKEDIKAFMDHIGVEMKSELLA